VNTLEQLKTAYNSTLAIGGVPSPLDSFLVAESSVFRTNFCGKKPAHRQRQNVVVNVQNSSGR
jgi:hypothetical protein